MTVIEEVLEFAHIYVSNRKEQTKERKRKIAKAYKQVFGRNMNIGCSTCYIESIFEIKRQMERKPCKYRLKPGVLLQAFGDETKTVTNKNLTDELAEFHLRTNPGTRKYFAIVPPEDEESNLKIVEPKKEKQDVKGNDVAKENISEVVQEKKAPVKRRTRKTK